MKAILCTWNTYWEESNIVYLEYVLGRKQYCVFGILTEMKAILCTWNTYWDESNIVYLEYLLG